MSTAIVVLGGHRSGTSCVAGVLHHLGVPMGGELLGPGPANPAGHFEDMEFFRLHQRILGEDNDPTAWRRPAPECDAFRGEYAGLVARRNRAHDVWGVKDPRLCFLMPLLLAAHGGGVQVVHVHRDPEQSARSLAAREGDLSDREAGEIVWAYYETARDSAALAVRRGPVLGVHVDFVVGDPRRAVAEIARFVRGVSDGEAGDIEAAVGFVEPALNHWKSPG